MGRIRVVAMECNYKELDRQLKDQFIHGFSDSDMLAEVIRELAKIDENILVTSEEVLVWAKRIEAQRAQAAVINSLSEVTDFDEIHAGKNKTKWNETAWKC